MKTHRQESDPSLIILSRRTELAMTQAELAKKMGYKNVNFISMVEGGKCLVPVEKSVDFARVLEMDTKWFIERVMRTRMPVVADFLFGSEAKTTRKAG